MLDTTPQTNAIISMQQFSTENDLSVENSAGGYLFKRPGVKLTLFPHLKYVRYNMETIKIPEAPFVADGELFIPLSLLQCLPESFKAVKNEIVSDVFILLDPGHGGEDTGAISGKAVEKDVVLDIARRTQRLLSAANIYSELTRDGDYFITLDQRSKIANRHPGAIFVSIHANAASSPQAQGIETFYLTSNISDNQRAIWVSSAYDFNTVSGRLEPDLELLAAEKISHQNRDQSKVLAEFVQSNLITNLKEMDRGVKQENFSVLRESFFGPAILIETGFLTHPQSRQKLLDPAYRQRLAENIANGIILFAKEYKSKL